MRISINVAHHARYGKPGGVAADLAEVVTAADTIGLDTVWVAERLLGPRDDACAADGTCADVRAAELCAGDVCAAGETAVLEAYTTLGFLASRSARVRLGAMAGAHTYRLPELTVRAAATLDDLSGGRARLGVSAGYAQYDGSGAHTSYAPVPLPLAERFGYVEDLLRLAGRGAHPPVTVAGLGEARMLPLVARYADGCNLLDVPQTGDSLARKLDILAVHCRKVGRPLSAVDLSATVRPRLDGPGRESSRELIARCRRLAGLGIDHVVVAPDGPWTRRALSTLAEAAPAIGELSGQPEPVSTVAYLDAYRVPAAGIPV
jgi:alkanesulfonate monooxygenase SsuD/methylene tetrahydromethanopterin reductase-like flavin-dependent oxidoreductase (luciferase family)